MRERLVCVAGRVLQVVGRDGEMVDRAEGGRPLVLVGEQCVKAAFAVGAVIVDGAALLTALSQMAGPSTRGIRGASHEQ